MLLIYVEKVTNRLGYTLNLIFKELMGLEYTITTNREYFCEYEGFKFSYCKEKICDEVFLYCDDILFRTTIEMVDLNYFEQDGMSYLFKVYSKDSVCNYDVLAAAFYMVSRYEEYLPFIQDKHSRFCSQDSIAFKKGFLEKPVVNIWVEELKKKIAETYPDMVFAERYFSFTNTIDVDSAYAYIGKGFWRSILGFGKDFLQRNFTACLRRIGTLVGKDTDPFDTFDYIIAQNQKYRLNTIFFVLFGYYGPYDKNITPDNYRFQQLVKTLCDYAKVGIHPSYESFDSPEQMNTQIRMLSSILHKPVKYSRFHFLRFRLPESYRTLMENNIEADYSMGYSDNVGFRAGICNSFNFYDLALDFETKLRVFPFAYMDVAFKNGLQLSPMQTLEKVKGLIEEVKKVNGNFISIWHNESLSDQMQWKGWREVYEGTLDYVSEINKELYTH